MNEQNNFDFTMEPGKTIDKRTRINDGKPLISIITPYYNAEKYIYQTANSIINQTFPYFEWIIVNDGSTQEGTDEILQRIKSRDNRIKILNKENGGPAAARYYGAMNAKSDIIFCLDADDLIDKTMLECGYFTLLTNQEATFAYSSICTFGDKCYLYSPLFDTIKEKKENIISVASFVRKQAFLELTEYSNLPKGVHEDWYMWLSFLSKGYKPVRMNFYGFWYRRLDTGRLNSINSNKNSLKLAEKYIKNIGKKVKKKVGAIQFPSSSDYYFDTYPKEFIWDRKPINIKGDKKRILCIFPWAIMGGADIFNLNLIRGLKENGYEITIVTTESKEYMYRQKFEEIVDEYFDLTTFLQRKDWAPFISYLITSRNIDIVFESNSFYGYYAIPWLKCKHKDVIFTDYLHAEDWSWRDGSYPRDSNAICKYLDRTFTCTNYLKNLMLNDMQRAVNNIDVVYIGTDPNYFDPSIELAEYNRLKNIYKDKKVILFPNRFEYLKRPLLLARVIYEIYKERKDILCIAAGYGKAKKDMDNAINEYGIKDCFKIVGAIDDLRPYYKLANVTVICSLTEGLTLTAYESLSMGTPVITSDVGGQSELIDDYCGKVIKKYQTIEKDLHNYNYDLKEIQEYKNAILEIIDLKDEEMKIRCRQKILNKFSSNDLRQQLINTLDRLIEDGSKVDKSICNNIEIAERYLILFNEVYKQNYFNPDEIDERTTLIKLRDKLWNLPPYRWIIYFLQKSGIMKVLKSIKQNKEKHE